MLVTILALDHRPLGAQLLGVFLVFHINDRMVSDALHTRTSWDFGPSFSTSDFFWMVSNAGPPFHGGRAKADDMKSAHRDAVRVRDFRVFIVLVSALQTWARGPKPANGVFPADCARAAVPVLLK